MMRGAALQRGASAWLGDEACESDADALVAGDLRYPRTAIVAGLLSGKSQDDLRDAELKLIVEAATGWLARDKRARLVLDAANRVLWANPSASRILVSPKPLTLQGETISLSESCDRDGFNAFLASLGPTVERHLLSDGSVDESVLVSGWAMRKAEASARFLEFVPRELPLKADESGMVDHFGLTSAECAVIDRLAIASSPKEIAAELGVAVSTVRSHIKSIYGKMGISNQVQLIRATCAYCGG